MIADAAVDVVAAEVEILAAGAEIAVAGADKAGGRRTGIRPCHAHHGRAAAPGPAGQ